MKKFSRRELNDHFESAIARNRRLVCALLLLLASMPPANAQDVELSPLDMARYSAYRVPSDAMEPAIRSGEVVYVDSKGFQAASLQAGDVVAFRPASSTAPILILKRVVALGGSTVQFRQWKLVVDGKVIVEPYVDPANVFSITSFEWGPMTVGKNCLFVLSDNRDEGNDSRTYGCVPTSDVVGVVKYVAPAATPGKARPLR